MATNRSQSEVRKDDLGNHRFPVAPPRMIITVEGTGGGGVCLEWQIENDCLKCLQKESKYVCNAPLE